MESVAEQWRDIPGFVGLYQASNLGRIRSLDHTVERIGRWGTPDKRFIPGVVRKLKDRLGYLTLNMGLPVKTYKVHTLVALAWIGEMPDGLVINHKDGNKHNNTPGNLEYITDYENHQHAARNGLLAIGERNGSAVLTEQLVRQIREFPMSVSNTDIGRKLGFAAGTVHRARTRQTWKHVA